MCLELSLGVLSLSLELEYTCSLNFCYPIILPEAKFIPKRIEVVKPECSQIGVFLTCLQSGHKTIKGIFSNCYSILEKAQPPEFPHAQ